jgi:hypothetical protein
LAEEGDEHTGKVREVSYIMALIIYDCFKE